jgi:hypothetical protein
LRMMRWGRFVVCERYMPDAKRRIISDQGQMLASN